MGRANVAKRVFALDVAGIHVLKRCTIKGADGRDLGVTPSFWTAVPGHDDVEGHSEPPRYDSAP